ncbi:uncharacterized protein [Oryza sativa Japonica Group]|uniref:uncharacterized protein isoform X2 n=1 Tax=Oryza sativa subsp. japonica TaxID=39947 RepID=UPI00339CFAB0
MVNGLVGSVDDWKFAADQLVRWSDRARVLADRVPSTAKQLTRDHTVFHREGAKRRHHPDVEDEEAQQDPPDGGVAHRREEAEQGAGRGALIQARRRHAHQ